MYLLFVNGMLHKQYYATCRAEARLDAWYLRLQYGDTVNLYYVSIFGGFRIPVPIEGE